MDMFKKTHSNLEIISLHITWDATPPSVIRILGWIFSPQWGLYLPQQHKITTSHRTQYLLCIFIYTIYIYIYVKSEIKVPTNSFHLLVIILKLAGKSMRSIWFDERFFAPRSTSWLPTIFQPFSLPTCWYLSISAVNIDYFFSTNRGSIENANFEDKQLIFPRGSCFQVSQILTTITMW